MYVVFLPMHGESKSRVFTRQGKKKKKVKYKGGAQCSIRLPWQPSWAIRRVAAARGGPPFAARYS